MKSKTIKVVGGIITIEDKILICQRQKCGEHPLKWEFPGGKVNFKESPKTALNRELREELKIEVIKSEFVCDYIFEYKKFEKKIHLYFFLIHQFSKQIEKTIHKQLKWIKIKHLNDYDFLEGDHFIISKILDNEFKIN